METQKITSFSDYNKTSYYCNDNCFMNNLEIRSYINEHFSHKHNLLCFEKCSIWKLNISSENNQFQFFGKIENQNKIFFETCNFKDIFPIDMNKYEIYNYSNCPKYLLKLEFKNINFSVDEKFYTNNFNININGSISHISENLSVFKNSRNFIATGIEICKEIKNYLSNINKYFINHNSNTEFEFTIPVYKNDKSFYVSFKILKENLKKLISKKFSMYDLFDYDIKITKFYFNNFIPFFAFCQNQNLYFFNNNINNINNNNNNKNINNDSNNNLKVKSTSNKKEKEKYMMNLIDEYEKNFPEFYCNFDRFINNINPIIYENDDLKVIDIFNIFKKASIYGIPMIFKNNNSLTHITFFPILKKVHIIQDLDNSLNTTFNTSIDSNIISYNLKDIEDYYFNSTYSKQLKYIFSKNDENYENLELNEISDKSYFSLLWIPNQKNHQFIGNKLGQIMNHSFEIYYKLKTKKKFGHKMEIINFTVKNEHGVEYKIDKNTNKFFKNFWVNNKSINKTQKNFFNISEEQNEIRELNENWFNQFKITI